MTNETFSHFDEKASKFYMKKVCRYSVRIGVRKGGVTKRGGSGQFVVMEQFMHLHVSFAGISSTIKLQMS